MKSNTRPSHGAQEEDKRSAGEDFNPKQYEGLLPKEYLNLPTTVCGQNAEQSNIRIFVFLFTMQVRALERMLVATLGVVETENPAIFEKMQPKAKVALTVSKRFSDRKASV